MKILRKILVVVMALVFCLGMAACARDDGTTKLKIAFFKAGFGDDWVYAIAEAFEAEHPGVKVIPEGHSNMETLVKNRLEAGNPNNIADIVSVTNMTFYNDYVRKGYLEDLTSLYTEEVEDGKTLDDVVLQEFKSFVTVNGKLYGVPWEGAVTGFAYNTKMFAQYGWKVPTTMDEFFQLCDDIVEDTNGTVAPLVYCGGIAEGYFQNIMLSWMSQYEGEEGTEEFFALESADVFLKEGRKLAYEQVVKIISDDSIVLSGSKGFDHLAAQREFIQGHAAMVPTGSWLETEMSEYLSEFPNFEMAIFAAPSIKPDGTDKTGTPRMVSTGNADLLAIPTKAKNKELAKEFLLFMSRQDMLKLFTEKTGGNPRPFVYDEDTDWSNLSTFGKSVMNVWQTSVNIFPYSDNAKYKEGRVGFWMAEAGMPVTYLQNLASNQMGAGVEHLVQADYDLAVQRLSD